MKLESQLRAEVVSEINTRLRTSFHLLTRLPNSLPGAITKGQATRMIYKMFDESITRKHGVIIKGWPLRTFDNQSAIGSQVELRVLLNAWQNGVTRFRKMSTREHMAWIENRTSPEPPSTPPEPPSTLPAKPTTVLPPPPLTQDYNPDPTPVSIPPCSTWSSSILKHQSPHW